MDRVTLPASDYCHVRCGSVNGCTRLTGDKKRCRDYDLYERLKMYENVWPAIVLIEIESSLLQGNGAETLINDLLNRHLYQEVSKSNEQH